MSRYLTPAKMGLLALIQLYVEGRVPSECTMEVLSFCGAHLLDSNLLRSPSSSCPGETSAGSAANGASANDRWHRAEFTISLVVSIGDFERLLNENQDPSLAGPMRILWQSFLDKLWHIDSLDALHEFFADLPELLAMTKERMRELSEAGHRDQLPPPELVRLTRHSPLGAFVRRAHLEFTKLNFHSASELWKDFARYRQATAAHWKKKHPGYQRLGFDTVLLEGQQEWDQVQLRELANIPYGDMLHRTETRSLPVSTHDVSKLLDFQVNQIQQYGSRLPTEMRLQLQDLLTDSYTIPSLSHYVNYVEAWKAADYPTSFDYLHRYFDYTIQTRDNLFYQYALMNLAILQSDFGCYKEAVAAMLEAVSTARENHDIKCLNFALNWLYHFGRAHPKFTADLEASSMLGGRETLAFLRDKAKETDMHMLWASAIWAEAKLGLENGESVATATELMTRGSQILVEYNMRDSFAAQVLLHMALWERLGLTTLACSSAAVALRVHRVNSAVEDDMRLTCHLAQLLTQQGRYQDAHAMLASVATHDPNTLRSARPRALWTKHRGLVALHRALQAGDLDAADELLSTSLLPSRNDNLDPNVRFTVDLLHVEFLVARHALPEAFAKVGSLMQSFDGGDDKNMELDGVTGTTSTGAGAAAADVAVRVKLLVVKARLLHLAGRTRRGFSIAMAAVGLAWRARLIGLLWDALGAVATVLLSLAEFAAAARLLTAVLPRALECNDLRLEASLWLLMADAEVGVAGLASAAGECAGTGLGLGLATASGVSVPASAATANSTTSGRHECLTRAIRALDRAADAGRGLGNTSIVKQVLAKKATICRVLGDRVASEWFAGQYVELVSGGRGGGEHESPEPEEL